MRNLPELPWQPRNRSVGVRHRKNQTLTPIPPIPPIPGGGGWKSCPAQKARASPRQALGGGIELVAEEAAAPAAGVAGAQWRAGQNGNGSGDGDARPQTELARGR